MGNIKVIVADSQRLFAQSLAIALDEFADLDVSRVDSEGEAATGLGAAKLISRLKPDVALMDYWLTEMDGPTATRAILRWAPQVKVIILSWFHGLAEAQASFDAGASGFLPKSLDIEEVAGGIRRAHAGERPIYQNELAHHLQGVARGAPVGKTRDLERFMKLTPREVEILHELAYGDSLQKVARSLAITPGTLRIHVQNILEKTGAKTKLEAIAMARTEGLFHD